jgi:hypothetical protein
MTVPRVYALYCSEFPDRELGLRDHLKARNVNAKYWRGFHGRSWGLDTRLEYDEGKRLPSGHVGLNLGSWAMWYYAYQDTSYLSDTTPILFLEDDAVLPDNWVGELISLQEELKTANPGWDLVFAGLAEAEPHAWQKVTERLGLPNGRVCRMSDPFGTHALLVRRRAIPVMLENMREARRNLDQQLYRNVLKPGRLNWCAVLPTIIRQRTFDYTGGKSPEWVASCLDTDPPTPTPTAQYCEPETQSGPPCPDAYLQTLRTIDPYPCLYRGEGLARHAREAPNGRSVPAYECALLAKPCHNRNISTRVLHGLNMQETLSCRDCKKRIELRPAETRRKRLPIPEGHFNPSIIRWRDKTILATRDSWGHSKVALWELKNSQPDWTGEWSVTPISSLGTDHPEGPRLEDPRLFVRRGPNGEQLCCAFNLPDKYPPKIVQVGMVVFTDDLQAVVETDVFPSPVGNAYEKNWVPFQTNRLNWVYGSHPRHVVMSENKQHVTDNPLPWTGGAVRGGATPVLVPGARDYGQVFVEALKNNGNGWDFPVGNDTRFYHFFHGCLKREFASIYTVGCLTFDVHEPYRVLKQTRSPIIWPDLPAEGEEVVKQRVVWPGGAIPHAGAWHIALGIDDTFCRIDRIPFEVVENALRDTPIGDLEVNSIRDTAVVQGVKKPRGV